MTPTEKAAQEALEEIFLKPAYSFTFDEQQEIILRHLAPVQEELDQLAKIRAVLKEPGLVWVNMLKGEIARPQALDHYEECKERVEALEAELARKDKMLAEAREIVKRYKDCAISTEGYNLAQDWLTRSAPQGDLKTKDSHE